MNKYNYFWRKDGYNTGNNKFWRDSGEKRTLLCCWWDCKLIQPATMEDGLETPQKARMTR